MKAGGESEAAGAAEEITERVKSVAWSRVAGDLDARGCSTIDGLLTPSECESLVALYDVEGLFRSRIVMARHGFGRGEYIVPLRQGDAVVFAVHHRPVQGTRGMYRVNLRHGVSRVRSGHRHTVGVIFHDAS